MASAAAIRDLNGHEVGGRKMKVELSTGVGKEERRSKTTKLFVGNVAQGTSQEELRALFEPHCPVIEADVIEGKNFGFVHVDLGPRPASPEGRQKLQEILERLNGADVRGNKVRIQSSTSGVRKSAGMGGESSCFRCGGLGHWSRECRGGYSQRGRRGRRREAPYHQPGGLSQNYNGSYGGYEEDYSEDYYAGRETRGGGPMRGDEGYYRSRVEVQDWSYRGYNNNREGYDEYQSRGPPSCKPHGVAPPSRGYSSRPPPLAPFNYNYSFSGRDSRGIRRSLSGDYGY